MEVSIQMTAFCLATWKVLRFRTDCKPLTHCCTLYSLVNWSSLSMQRLLHCLTSFTDYPWTAVNLFILLHVMQAVQSQPLLPGLYYTQHSLCTNRVWIKKTFLLCPLNLENTAVGSGAVRLDPTGGFSTYFKETWKSIFENVFLFVVFLNNNSVCLQLSVVILYVSLNQISPENETSCLNEKGQIKKIGKK